MLGVNGQGHSWDLLRGSAGANAGYTFTLGAQKYLKQEPVNAAPVMLPQVVDISDMYTTPGNARLAKGSQIQELMLEDSLGSRVSVTDYVTPQELSQLKKLDPKYLDQVLNIQRNQPKEKVRQQLADNLKLVIADMVRNSHVKFREENSQWGLSELLGLANAIQRLPKTQQQQLAQLTFERKPRPPVPEGVELGMLEQIASETIAGQYLVGSKSLVIYDRGANDGFPELSGQLRGNLRVIQNKGNAEEVRQLQKLLNPYMTLLDQPALKEDGGWGAQTARAVRMTQMELLNRHVQQLPLTKNQQEELRALTTLAASPQFDLITRLTDIQKKMQNLNLIPDPHLKQLLQEFTKNEFGEASLKFLMQDVSNDFRTTPSVSRVEEIATHEIGHHIQLGNGNESFYVGEFAKLSNWRESQSGEKADGFINGTYAAEDLQAVYHKLACDCKEAKGNYQVDLSPSERSQKFVSDYAATDPMEDFAESYKDFMLNPGKLLKASPEKFFFINAMGSLQAQTVGVQSDANKYNDAKIIELVRSHLQEQYRQSISDTQVHVFIREQFQKIMDMGNPGSRKLHLSSDTIAGICNAHNSLLLKINAQELVFDYRNAKVSIAEAAKDALADDQVLRQVQQKSQILLESQGKDPAAKAFFSQMRQPQNIDTMFPQASASLRSKLKDPTYAAMMQAIGQIGGYSRYVNRLTVTEEKDRESYEKAKGYFSSIGSQPSALLSNKSVSYGLNYLRGLGSELLYNSEETGLDRANKFFALVQTNPQQAFPDIWGQLPDEFKDLLKDRRFIDSLSGNQGRFAPSNDTAYKVFNDVVDMVEFQRSL